MKLVKTVVTRTTRGLGDRVEGRLNFHNVPLLSFFKLYK